MNLELFGVTLEIKHLSSSYGDMRISLIPLRYSVVVILSRNNLNQALSSNLKVPNLDIKIKRSRLTLNT